MGEFRMPSLGADMDEGTVLEWLVSPGDVVAKGDVVAVVDTAKSAVDVETFEGGVVEQILVAPGTKVAVGTPLAVIGAEVPAPAVAAAPAVVAAAPIAVERPRKPPKRPPSKVSPVVRRYARQLGVDPATLDGTGPGGRVTHADVERVARPAAAAAQRPRVTPYARRRARELGVDLGQVQAPAGQPIRAEHVEAAAVAAPAVPYPRTVEPAPAVPARPEPSAQERTAAMRRAIGALMSRSKREVPHYYLTDTVDLTAAVEWLRRHNQDLPVAERVVVAALFCKATALAARRVPQLNGYWVDDAFQPADAVHLGVAVSLRGGGLVTPAVHDAANLSVTEMMAALRDLVERSRRGVLHRRELTEGTLTVTNLGERGAESVLGVIFPPQVGLVGFGRVTDAVRAVDGLVGVRPTTTVTLSGDHRASDGHTGGAFLDAVRTLLEHPEEL
jgi:pyruvate dehydrogenase E2 component (dihydrolipoamide acetyltransferase)